MYLALAIYLPIPLAPVDTSTSLLFYLPIPLGLSTCLPRSVYLSTSLSIYLPRSTCLSMYHLRVAYFITEDSTIFFSPLREHLFFICGEESFFCIVRSLDRIYMRPA